MTEELKSIIYDIITEARTKMATSDLVKAVAAAAGVPKRGVRRAIEMLVTSGELQYTYIYGTSFLQTSFDRPVRLSKRIIVKPPHKMYEPRREEIVVDMTGGAAFGDGSHPSTSLALRAMDAVLGDRLSAERKIPLKALDVGTGTGILAIALAKLGVQAVTATDIDPCSRVEAAYNAEMNGVAEQVTVTGTPASALGGFYGLIIANLAYPTLKTLSPILTKKMESNGILILSGFKETAAKSLKAVHERQGLRLIREETQRQWVCLALRKPGVKPKSNTDVIPGSPAKEDDTMKTATE
jgi:ribosomal protein L11 methyltransferase